MLQQLLLPEEVNRLVHLKFTEKFYSCLIQPECCFFLKERNLVVENILINWANSCKCDRGSPCICLPKLDRNLELGNAQPWISSQSFLVFVNIAKIET
jgi:hypothetical protein